MYQSITAALSTPQAVIAAYEIYTVPEVNVVSIVSTVETSGTDGLIIEPLCGQSNRYQNEIGMDVTYRCLCTNPR